VDKLNELQEAIVLALPQWSADGGEWASRKDVHAVPNVERLAALKTVGNNLAKLVAAGVVERATGHDNGVALYRQSESYTRTIRTAAHRQHIHVHMDAAKQDAQAADDRCESEGCDIPDGYAECRRCGAEAADVETDIAEDNGDEPETYGVTEGDFPDAVWDAGSDDSPAFSHGGPLPEGIKVEGARDADGVLYVAPLGTSPDDPGWVRVGEAREGIPDTCADTGRTVDECECEYHGGPIHTGKPAESAAEQSETGGVERSAPVPAAPVSDDPAAVAAFLQAVRPVSAPPAPEPRAARGRPEGGWRKFAIGQLNTEVADFLANHLSASQQQDGVSPTVIAKALNAQVGSVAFACMKLAERGAARQTSAKPKRYAAPQ
jgi:hypothetical protein